MITEGSLSSENLRGLIRLMSRDQLFQLQQKNIHSALLDNPWDEVLLAVLRPNYSWQSLDFPSPESRHPFRETLDPLLEWFDRIQKDKGRKLSEDEGRSSCQVAGEIRLKERTARTTVDTAPTTPPPDEKAVSNSAYLFRLSTLEPGYRHVEATCLIAFSNGDFHGVRQSENAGNKERKTTVLDGNLTEDDIRALHSILDSEQLRGFANSSSVGQFILGTLTRLSIPRGTKTQEIHSWKFFDNIGRGVDRLRDENKKATNLLKPLTEWLKAKVPQNKEVNADDPPNPKCLPAL